MGDFLCPNCGQQLAFENSLRLSCGGALGFVLDERALPSIIASALQGRCACSAVGMENLSSPHVRWGSRLLDLVVNRDGSCSRMLTSLWGGVAGFEF